MEYDQNATGFNASTSAGLPVKPPTAETNASKDKETKDVYGKVEIDIKVEIVVKGSNKPKDKEMNKIFEALSDEVKIARPVGPLFRSIYLKLSKFNGEFCCLRRDPGALVFSTQFTSLKDIYNFKKEKSQKELKPELMNAFEGYLSGKNPFDKLDMIITVDPKKQIAKDVKNMKKESHDNVSEGENLGKEMWIKNSELREVDKHLEDLINKRCTLVADTECIYLLGLHKFQIQKDNCEANKRSIKNSDEKNDKPKKKKKKEPRPDEDSNAQKVKEKEKQQVKNSNDVITLL